MGVATWARNSRRNPPQDERRPRNSATGGQTAPSERFAQRESLAAVMVVFIKVAGIARRNPDRLPRAAFDAAADAPVSVGGVRQLDEEMVDIPGRKPELVAQKFLQEGFQSQLVDNVVERVGRQRHLAGGPGDDDAEFVDVDVATNRR